MDAVKKLVSILDANIIKRSVKKKILQELLDKGRYLSYVRDFGDYFSDKEHRQWNTAIDTIVKMREANNTRDLHNTIKAVIKQL